MVHQQMKMYKMYLKMKNHLLTLVSFKTCMTFFLPLNTTEDILKNVHFFETEMV